MASLSYGGGSVVSKQKIPEYPRLKLDRKVETFGDRVFLNAEGRHSIVQGQAVVDIVSLLDGTRDVAEICEQVSSVHSLAEVLRALTRLSEFGHLTNGPASESSELVGWWDRLGLTQEGLHEHLSGSRVGLVTLGDPSGVVESEMMSALAGELVDPTIVEPSNTRDDLSLLVVSTDDYLNPDLAKINEAMLGGKTPWIIFKPTGAILWIGPYFVPGDTGCWACLSQRLAANRQVERFLGVSGQETWTAPSPVIHSRGSLGTALSLAALSVARLVGDPDAGYLRGVMRTFDLVTLEAATHVLIKQPQCRACGDFDFYSQPRPVRLESQPKQYVDDGGHRIYGPQVTVERLEKHVSPLIGAVTSLHKLTEPGDEVTNAYVAGHNFAMFSHSTYVLRRSVRGLSGGKGRSDIQAKASAICEAIERYCGVWRGDEPTVQGSFEDLAGRAINPESLLCFSRSQYENREAWNQAQTGGLQLVPEPFDTTRSINWSQAWSITHDEPRLVPSAYCYFGNPDNAQRAFCFSDSNGNAAGNNLEEAVLQGLLELVERDSVAIWWYNRLRVPKVDLGSIDDPYVETVSRYYRDQGRDLWLLDITSDLGIPSMVAVSHRLDHPKEDVVLGFGAHVDPKLAAMRAITECNQFLPMLSKRDREGNTIYDVDDREALEWWKNASLETDPYVVASPDLPMVDLSHKPGLERDDITDEIRACVEAISGKGMEVIVLDQSRPDLDIKVAKVMVPGMRHFWRRLGPGRLYEVPVELGYLERPLRECDLNPKSVFF